MRYLYGISDEKFVKGQKLSHVVPTPLATFKFRVHPFIKGKSPFNKNDVSIVFKASPDTLVNLCTNIIDKFPLPSVFTWTNVDVCNWIRKYGYRHYQRTFRENLINGRTLLLVDATALQAMNIKNFDEIKHIAYGIRSLFYFEMVKFSRSISLAPQNYYELFKLFRVRTGGLEFQQTRRSDLWRKMQLLREKTKYLRHWELLEKWLSLEPDPLYPELFGAARRRKLYKCKPVPPPKPKPPKPFRECYCMPPCECYWTERDTRMPTVFGVLDNRKPDPDFKLKCTKDCMPPCTCHWGPKKFMENTVLSCLQHSFPHKYGQLRINRFANKTEDNVSLRLSIWDV